MSAGALTTRSGPELRQLRHARSPPRATRAMAARVQHAPGPLAIVQHVGHPGSWGYEEGVSAGWDCRGVAAHHGMRATLAYLQRRGGSVYVAADGTIAMDGDGFAVARVPLRRTHPGRHRARDARCCCCTRQTGDRRYEAGGEVPARAHGGAAANREWRVLAQADLSEPDVARRSVHGPAFFGGVRCDVSGARRL